jgi:hypothetical protein
VRSRSDAVRAGGHGLGVGRRGAADAGKTLTIALDDDEGHPLAERTLKVRAAKR